MDAGFSGSTASHYGRYRRDVPDGLLDRLIEELALTGDSLALDLGAGTGQVAVPLAARLGTVLAVEPEPDMLAQLRQRAQQEGVQNLLPVLASDLEVPVVLDALGRGRCRLLTVANALHWMDAPALFAAARCRLAPGGAVVIITHGIPIWLGRAEWSRAVNRYLADWFGRPVTGGCGSDAVALRQRQHQLAAAGFGVAVLTHRYGAALDTGYVLGHLYSAMSESALPAAERPRFEQGLREVLGPFGEEPMVEDVPVTALVGRR